MSAANFPPSVGLGSSPSTQGAASESEVNLQSQAITTVTSNIAMKTLFPLSANQGQSQPSLAHNPEHNPDDDPPHPPRRVGEERTTRRNS